MLVISFCLNSTAYVLTGGAIGRNIGKCWQKTHSMAQKLPLQSHGTYFIYFCGKRIYFVLKSNNLI
jgi:hypothetical protein